MITDEEVQLAFCLSCTNYTQQEFRESMEHAEEIRKLCGGQEDKIRRHQIGGPCKICLKLLQLNKARDFLMRFHQYKRLQPIVHEALQDSQQESLQMAPLSPGQPVILVIVRDKALPYDEQFTVWPVQEEDKALDYARKHGFKDHPGQDICTKPGIINRFAAADVDVSIMYTIPHPRPTEAG